MTEPNLESVRRVLADARDVELPDDMAPHPSEDAGQGGDDDPYQGMEPDYTPLSAEGESAEALREASTFPINDLGNGQRFVLHFGEDVMFVPRVGWHVWDGHVWAVDPDMIAARRKAQRLSELVLAEVPYLVLSEEKMLMIAEERALKLERDTLEKQTDEDGKLSAETIASIARVRHELGVIDGYKTSLSKIRTAHRTFARSTGNTAKIKAAMTEAEVPLAVKVEDLDTRHLDVNTLSGVLRFNVTPRPGTYPAVNVETLPHDRALRMTKIMATAYDNSARCPIFYAFLDRIMPDPQMQSFLQRWFGYSMLGLTNEQALAFFFGMGANGKSAMVDLMARLLGSYAATAKIESLTGQNRRSGGDATPDLINIVGARMVRASEPEKGVQWQEGLIKQLTGGEPILVRALNENFFEAEPRFKLTIGGNHAPDIRGMDDGIWRRLMIVPFDVQIPKEERDPMLVQRMMAEGPGILNWLVDGARFYLEGGLSPPEQVMAATDTLRKDADPYGKFLDQACIVTGDERDSLSSRELMLCFMFWQMQKGETPFKERTISTNMKEHSRRWRSPKTGKQFVARETGRFNGYDGLRLTDIFRRDWDLAPKNTEGRALSLGQAADPNRYGDDY
ncbi:phage/plasmid primase, P4 family [Cypionkella sinensis]|uniref:Phage/plasmid primase, P4 family n=1 Tax=Cypionkella sinensis TaxID=1756043 RepID=A0ABV7IVB2_9RHOB